MSVLESYKCPNCDGAIEFDSGAQKMVCPYCDCEFEPEALREFQQESQQQEQSEMKWETEAGGTWQEGEAEALRVYSCATCGGEIVADETTGATECPFCGNPVVMSGQFAGDLKPDLVIPFKLDKKAAVDALHRHYKGKVLLPDVFKDQNHIKEVKGLYVPVWLFGADADAHVRYRATRVRHWSDSQYNYTATSHYAVARGGRLGFDNVPVDGSTKMDDALMESVEPFHVEDAVDFRTAYLAGYLADRYDVSAEDSISRANQRIRSSTQDAFAATVMGYTTVTPVSTDIRLEQGNAKYALYPVWVLNTQWNGTQYIFAMNGQTGKLAGNLPMDKSKFWRWLLGITGAVTAGVLALSYLFWLM